jgi:hypothetical protein
MDSIGRNADADADVSADDVVATDNNNHKTKKNDNKTLMDAMMLVD